jgi:hypothetical protein
MELTWHSNAPGEPTPLVGTDEILARIVGDVDQLGTRERGCLLDRDEGSMMRFPVSDTPVTGQHDGGKGVLYPKSLQLGSLRRRPTIRDQTNDQVTVQELGEGKGLE